MYFEKAIERINNIDWAKIDAHVGEYDYDKNLGGIYLHRLAVFIREYSLNPEKRFFTNIAEELGDKGNIDVLSYCNVEAQEKLKKMVLPRYITMYYLQLANYADKNPKVYKYMQVYDPMIQLLEEGFMYEYKEAGLMIYDGSFYPLGGWYETFLNADFS